VKERPVIALVCDTIYPYSHGGREHRYRQLLPRLAELADVHVYTMHWWNGPRTYSDGGVTYHAIAPLLALYKDGRRSLRQALGFGLACLRLAWHDFDVLEADHIPYLQVLALRIVASLKGRPFIVTWHEVWSRSNWRQYLGWAGLAAWALESLAMQLPDHIIAASPQTAERLRAGLRRGIPITTVPNGIDLEAIRSSHSDADVTDIVAVGRLIDHKRVDMLLDVIAMLKARGMHVTCRVIGDGPERVALQERARMLGISGAVDFRSDVDEQKDLYALLKAARLFVSLSAREGFGIAVLEAIACGVPVLTTSAPDNLAWHLVAQYSQGVVCEPTAEAVAAAIEQVLAQAGHCRADDNSIDSWVADYDWAAMAGRLMGVYAQPRSRVRQP
jgi:glycosyltransferase involved in cell wall biosynthesis